MHVLFRSNKEPDLQKAPQYSSDPEVKGPTIRLEGYLLIAEMSWPRSSRVAHLLANIWPYISLLKL